MMTDTLGFLENVLQLIIKRTKVRIAGQPVNCTKWKKLHLQQAIPEWYLPYGRGLNLTENTIGLILEQGIIQQLIKTVPITNEWFGKKDSQRIRYHSKAAVSLCMCTVFERKHPMLTYVKYSYIVNKKWYTYVCILFVQYLTSNRENDMWNSGTPSNSSRKGPSFCRNLIVYRCSMYCSLCSASDIVGKVYVISISFRVHDILIL